MILNKKPTEGRIILHILHSACEAGSQNDLVQYFVEFCASIVEFLRWDKKKTPKNNSAIDMKASTIKF